MSAARSQAGDAEIVQVAALGCEIANIHAAFCGFAQGKFRFDCLGEEIPAVQIDGSGAWILTSAALAHV